jgi:hypothetical protein
VTRNNVISYPRTVLDEGRYENMLHDMKHIVVLPYVEIRDTVCEIVKEDKKWDVTHKYLTDVYEQGCRTRQFVVNDRVYTEEQCTFVLNKLVKVYTRRKDHLFKMVNVIFGVEGVNNVKRLLKIPTWETSGGLKEKTEAACVRIKLQKKREVYQYFDIRTFEDVEVK